MYYPRPIEGHRDDQPGDVEDGIKALEPAARLSFSGATITEYPLEDWCYDQPEYEPFWTAAALGLPLSLHTATRRQGKIRGPERLRDASSRAATCKGPVHRGGSLYRWVLLSRRTQRPRLS